jgi:hypothetical protein
MKITINRAALDIFADRIVTGFKRAGDTVDALSATALPPA